MVIASAAGPKRGRSPVLDVRRREFISLLGGAAAWPLAAGSQPAKQKRRIVAVLWNFASDDAEGLLRLTSFGQGLQELGWTLDPNLVSPPQ